MSNAMERASILRVTDLWRLPARLPFALALARAAAADPWAFWIAAVAMRRHRALQKPLELCRYLSFLKARHIVRALEIGTWSGGTFYAHCAVAAPHAHLIALDSSPPESGQLMTARFQSLARSTQTVTCSWNDSHSDAAMRDIEAALNGARLDLLFLDGDHSFEGVQRDYAMYSPLVRKGGVIALHDIAADATRGVPTFWRTLRQQHESVEFVDRIYPPHGLGIGAIVKGD